MKVICEANCNILRSHFPDFNNSTCCAWCPIEKECNHWNKCTYIKNKKYSINTCIQCEHAQYNKG